MLTYIRIVYSYFKLLYYVRQTDYKTVQKNEELVDFFVNTIENCGSMAIKCVQWILPRFQLSNPNSILPTAGLKFLIIGPRVMAPPLNAKFK